MVDDLLAAVETIMRRLIITCVTSVAMSVHFLELPLRARWQSRPEPSGVEDEKLQDRTRVARARANLTQQELGEKIGMVRKTMNADENVQAPLPTRYFEPLPAPPAVRSRSSSWRKCRHPSPRPPRRRCEACYATFERTSIEQPPRLGMRQGHTSLPVAPRPRSTIVEVIPAAWGQQAWIDHAQPGSPPEDPPVAGSIQRSLEHRLRIQPW